MRVTKTEFQVLWCEWTGDQLHEARHRIRMCSEAGLLPERSTPLSDDDIVRAVLAFLGSETHKDAPAVVREFSEFHCTAYEPGGDETITSGNLLKAIGTSLRPPFSLKSLAVSSNGRWATLHVIRDGDPFTNKSYHFTGAAALDLPQTTFPPIISRLIGSELTGRLSSLMTGDETTKAAGAPPPNGPQSTPKQTAKPVQPHTEHLTHSRNNRQSRRRGGLPLPKSER